MSLRRQHWQLQRSLGIEHLPVERFFPVRPRARHGGDGRGGTEAVCLDEPGSSTCATYFAMARGTKEIPPLDMTKWFDTNYHYIVPEFEPGMRFRVASTTPIEQFQEAAVH